MSKWIDQIESMASMELSQRGCPSTLQEFKGVVQSHEELERWIGKDAPPLQRQAILLMFLCEDVRATIKLGNAEKAADSARRLQELFDDYMGRAEKAFMGRIRKDKLSIVHRNVLEALDRGDPNLPKIERFKQYWGEEKESSERPGEYVTLGADDASWRFHNERECSKSKTNEDGYLREGSIRSAITRVTNTQKHHPRQPSLKETKLFVAKLLALAGK